MQIVLVVAAVVSLLIGEHATFVGLTLLTVFNAWVGYDHEGKAQAAAAALGAMMRVTRPQSWLVCRWPAGHFGCSGSGSVPSRRSPPRSCTPNVGRLSSSTHILPWAHLRGERLGLAGLGRPRVGPCAT